MGFFGFLIACFAKGIAALAGTGRMKCSGEDGVVLGDRNARQLILSSSHKHPRDHTTPQGHPFANVQPQQPR